MVRLAYHLVMIVFPGPLGLEPFVGAGVFSAVAVVS
jgi:hypothetical protein